MVINELSWHIKCSLSKPNKLGITRGLGHTWYVSNFSRDLGTDWYCVILHTPLSTKSENYFHTTNDSRHKMDVESQMLAQDQLLKPSNYGVLKSMLHIFLPAPWIKVKADYCGWNKSTENVALFLTPQLCKSIEN